MQQCRVNQRIAQQGTQARNAIAEEDLGQRDKRIALQMGIDRAHNRYDLPLSHHAPNVGLGLAREVDVHADDLYPLATQFRNMLLDQFRELCGAAKTGQTDGKDDTRFLEWRRLRPVLTLGRLLIFSIQCALAWPINSAVQRQAGSQLIKYDMCTLSAT